MSRRAVSLCAASLCVLAIASAPAPAGSATFQGDARFLRAAIDSIHPSPYRVHSRAEWDSAAGALERRLPGLAAPDAVCELSRFVALAADGHTRLQQVRLRAHTRPELEPPPGLGFEREFPIQCHAFADGLYILDSDTARASLRGARIVAVEGKPVVDVVRALEPFIPSDNSMWRLHLLPQFLRSPEYLHAAGVSADIASPLALTIERAPGRKEEVRVPAVARGGVASGSRLPGEDTARPVPLYRSLEDNYSIADLGGSPRILYVRLRQIQNAEKGPTLAQFAERLLAYVDSAAVDRLVLDVRGNGGGDNYLNQPLVHGLIASRRVNQPGHLFVITDRGTFSAAVSLVADLERNTHALFVGEPTGAGPNSYGDSKRDTLPASGLVVRISALYWQHSDPRDARPWIAPDLPAPVSYADYLARKDPALEMILAYRVGDQPPVRPPNTNWARPSQESFLTPSIRW
ncbi:MAG: hypothetical protein ACREOU_00675 [Candidatus Eiseniibacteriota bacterium]